MKTLAGPSSGILAGESRLSSSRDALVCRPESFFRLSHPLVGVGVLHLPSSSRRRSIQPVSPLSSEPQVDLDIVDGGSEEDDRSQEIHHSRTVHVRFQIQKECLFGDEFLLVGDDPMLGLWDPDNGIPLTWSNDHVWTAEMDMPIGKTIQYKFILKESTGTISWQPGPDRTFQSWETINMITVFEEWEDAENQKLIEDDGYPSPNVEPTVNSEVSVVDEKLMYPKEDIVSNISNGPVVSADDNSCPAGKSTAETPKELVFTSSIPSQEKPMAIVADHIGNANEDLVAKELADNIGSPKKDLVAKEPTDVLSDKRTDPAKVETVDIPNKDKVIAKDAPAQNSRGAEVKNPSTDVGKNKKRGEASPVPVPGLALAPSKVTTKEAVQTQREERNVGDVSDGPNDDKSFNPPEPDGDSCLQETNETFNNGEGNHAKLKQQSLSAKEELPRDKKLQAELEQQQPLLVKEEEQVNSEAIKGITGKDVHWGLRLQKLLANIGLA